jgi:hypothetical protein
MKFLDYCAASPASFLSKQPAAPSLVAEMASPLFCHGFLDDFGLKALLGVRFFNRQFSSSSS